MTAARLAPVAIALSVLLLSRAPAAGQELGARALETAKPVGYFIQSGDPRDGYRPGDRQLAQWALEAWQRTIGTSLTLTPAAEPAARVRVYWTGPQGGQYGEMRPLLVAGQRGAAVFVRPAAAALGPAIAAMAEQDPLLRETIVYLACVHSLGHAFGLAHTADVRDIMYLVPQDGGAIAEYFDRYRRRIKTRDDISRLSPMSDADVVRMRTLYPER